MKNLIYIALIILFASCDKEIVEPEQPKKPITNTYTINSVTGIDSWTGFFISDAKELPGVNVENYHSTFAGFPWTFTSESDSIYIYIKEVNDWYYHGVVYPNKKYDLYMYERFNLIYSY